jgi:hypothetical protein
MTYLESITWPSNSGSVFDQRSNVSTVSLGWVRSYSEIKVLAIWIEADLSLRGEASIYSKRAISDLLC